MQVPERFRDRTEAGRRLARELAAYAGRQDVVVLGLLRGGAPVAFQVAHDLGVPADVLLVRKLRVPGREDRAIGAIAADGTRVLNEAVIRELGVSDDAIALAAADQQHELERRERALRRERPELEVEGRVVIVVDEGAVTGATMGAAAAALRARNPSRLVVALPVADAEVCDGLRELADEVACPMVVEPFDTVARWYDDLGEITDEAVRELLTGGPTTK